ncbi:uncharacterized protein F5Z01DRAFT_665617 [Emericellopsis atlantica]|uniref:Uncharacterized protein n=1 Tax=Emericellopsis atlantica TaxID=2614577 RepID=A0A9P8CKS9_9HYPO|nr:uncharacterized protein F5Z01DRAFT_665617 [Emericellopsis atlantica]KAG9250663.1 hypothetical protein F5Z01DRAFT_665617 [Emericellopsis atlantica]
MDNKSTSRQSEIEQTIDQCSVNPNVDGCPPRLAMKRPGSDVDSQNANANTSPDRKRQRVSKGKPRRATWDARQPSPGSILALIQGERKQLWVPGIAWGEIHLRSMDVVFERRKMGKTTKVDLNGAAVEESGKWKDDFGQGGTDACQWEDERWCRATRQLSSYGEEVQRLAARQVLETFGLVYTERPASRWSGGEQRVKENEVAFQFGGQCVDKLRTDGLFGRGHRGRCMAYINFDTISRLRVRYADRRWHTGPPEERKQKKLSMNPVAAWEEPYVVDVLICLAQEQAALGGEEGEDEGGWWVHVLGLEGAPARNGYLYTAWIPKAFLDKLEKPWEAIKCQRVVVKYEAIKLEKQKLEKTAHRLWRSFKRNFTDFRSKE